MAITPFNGTLSANEVYTSVYNQIINQVVNANVINGTDSELVDLATREVSRFGSKMLYYFTDCLATHGWTPDADTNVLSLDRPSDPFVQAIEVNKFRQIRLTTDDLISPRMFSDEYAFAQFASVMTSWIEHTRKIYLSSLYNVYVGGTITSENGQLVALPAPTTGTGPTDEISTNKLFAESIAVATADVLNKLTSLNRMNDLGYARSWSYDDLIVIWNLDAVEKIDRASCPEIFNKEGLVDKWKQYVLPSRFFTTPNTSAITAITYVSSNYDLYANKECDLEYQSGSKKRKIHVYPGDLIFKTVKSLDGANSSMTLAGYYDDGSTTLVSTFAAGDVREVPATDKVVCKITTKDAIPLLQGFTVSSEFYNAKNHSINRYLTLGTSEPQYLYDRPFVTITIA